MVMSDSIQIFWIDNGNVGDVFRLCVCVYMRLFIFEYLKNNEMRLTHKHHSLCIPAQSVWEPKVTREDQKNQPDEG